LAIEFLKNSEAWRNGYTAFQTNKIYDNPYTTNTAEYVDYANGFIFEAHLISEEVFGNLEAILNRTTKENKRLSKEFSDRLVVEVGWTEEAYFKYLNEYVRKF